MKPKELFSQILTIDIVHEACENLFMFSGKTIIELPGIPLGTQCLVSFMLERGIAQFEEDLGPNEDIIESNSKLLGEFAMVLTLEPIPHDDPN